MNLMIELFYSPICPHCPKAREVLLEVLEEVDAKIHLDEVNILSSEGLKKAEECGVMSVPTTIINMRRKIVGVPVKERLLKLVNDEITKQQTGEDEKE